ncbi:MAG: hypothetical protein A2V77_02170 [Anaeromyxobacter sp. RBG_16_69_14]|nr:MAG: hypothetical protein A2V77_02170 [Anaeromyxobacter sp. RBG_16_69_14]
MNAREEESEATVLAAAGFFGRWLLQERELRGLPRREVVRLTKLAPAVVEALESGDPDRMPPKAYVFGYLRTYAGVVGLDADDVVLRWQEVVGPEESVVEQPRWPPARILVAIALAIALVVIALARALFPPARERPSLHLRKAAPMERAPYPPAGR